MTSAPGRTALWSILAAATLLAVDHPVLLAVLTAALLVAVRHRDLLGTYANYARYVLLIGAVFLVLNPVLAPLGRTVLLRATVDIPILGRPVVTAEAMLFAATATLRLLGLLAVFTVLGHAVAPEELFDLLRRVRVPARAALATTLSVRFLPVLAEDARTIGRAQRARGLRTDGVRGSLSVLGPLLGQAVDRGLDLAEVLTARGFGAGPRTRIRSERRSARPAVLAGIPLGLALGGFGSYAFYPVLDPVLPSAVDAAFAVLAVAALLVAGWTR